MVPEKWMDPTSIAKASYFCITVRINLLQVHHYMSNMTTGMEVQPMSISTPQDQDHMLQWCLMIMQTKFRHNLSVILTGRKPLLCAIWMKDPNVTDVIAAELSRLDQDNLLFNIRWLSASRGKTPVLRAISVTRVVLPSLELSRKACTCSVQRRARKVAEVCKSKVAVVSEGSPVTVGLFGLHGWVPIPFQAKMCQSTCPYKRC